MAASTSSTTAAAAVRLWRTAFLTLRDETLTSPPSIRHLVHSTVFSHSHSLLIAAASALPPHEVTSDLFFLMELVANASEDQHDLFSTFSDTCRLVHDVSTRVSLEINSSSWRLVLDSFSKMVDCFLGNAAFVKPVNECLETLRNVVSTRHSKFSLSDDIHLVKFLLDVISNSYLDLVSLYRSSSSQKYAAEIGKKLPRCSGLWDVQTASFSMISEAFSRSGSSFPSDIWHSTIEVLRKILDVLASKNLAFEENVMSRFYASLLHCLHVVLTDAKCSISEHMSGFVTALRMFFVYGLIGRPQGPQLTFISANTKGKELGLVSQNLALQERKKTDKIPYRPPHLRKKDSLNMKHVKSYDSQSSSDHESTTTDPTFSDSDLSDSDGSLKDIYGSQSSKVRAAALLCVQDLCQADRKSLTTQWTMLLPTHDVLQPRKYEATLMTCLLFDPYLKARIASASALEVMLDGPSSVFLQVAEYKESSKCGSFVALSSSLGQILMQLHTGILYLIERETNGRLLGAVFKILVLLISCTPYSRMSGELLPKVIDCLLVRIKKGFPFRSDQTGLLAAAFSCFTAALSVSPSTQVNEMLLEEVSTGFFDAEKSSGVLNTLFEHSEQLSSSIICFESLQALRAVLHHYPNLVLACWAKVSATVSKIFGESCQAPTRMWKEQGGNTVGFVGEKIVTAAIKVLDESLRAISGFKGTEDLSDENFLDTPFTSDCIRTKKVSSAPSYGAHYIEDAKGEQKTCDSGSEQWAEAIEKHIPLILWHTSSMVRTASVTCFAGITSSVVFALSEEKRNFIISSLINAAVVDEVPSVRSASCRAIGVISCFQQILESAEILDKFVHAIEINTWHSLAAVRITASWALANICDSIRHCMNGFHKEQSTDRSSKLVDLLTECALRLTKDGDKIKSNAVRALGNLSRFSNYTSSSCLYDNPAEVVGVSSTANNAVMLPASSALINCNGKVKVLHYPASQADLRWLERIVQAFISCVTTGNVKVQWNVCHALSNMFMNRTLRLQDMDWAPSIFSILLLLLRDSSNFKIRIQAAAALTVPTSILDYGKSYPDVVQGLEHVIENLSSDKITAPSNFKYRVALEKQLTSTMLHVISLASGTDHQPLLEFLVRKASFLEEWFRTLCMSLEKTDAETDFKSEFRESQKRAMISKAISALIDVYECGNNYAIAQRFNKLDDSIS